MNLGALRTWFITESGRYDLTTNTLVADYYLKVAQRILDRRCLSDKNMASKHMQDVAANTNSISFPDCRAIHAVCAVKVSDYSKSELVKTDRRFIEEKLLETRSDVGATPSIYAPGVIRLAPEKTFATPDGSSTDIPSDLLDLIVAEASYAYNGLIFYPRTDEEYIIEVDGLFYTTWPDDDTETTFWMHNHPEMVVWAAQMVLEMFARNTEGVKDWEKVLSAPLQEIYLDFIEEEVVDIDQMDG